MRVSTISGLAVTAVAAATVTVPSSATAQEVVPPANDDIAGAIPIVEGGSRADTTIGATRAPTDPAGLSGERTVWYSFSSFVGAPVQVETVADDDSPDYFERFVVYRGTDGGGLETVAVGGPENPRFYDRRQVARFPAEKGVDYYIGVASAKDGGDFSLTVDRAKRPSTLYFPDMQVIGSGPTGQLYTERGQRPRIRIRVETGFAGERTPGRGPVTLDVDGGAIYKKKLDQGRVTFVLPRIRRGFSFSVRYPGSARIDPATESAAMLIGEGP